jgi:two-component system, NtrC family, sensor histidine kinase PilS
MNELSAHSVHNGRQQDLSLLKVYTLYRTLLAFAILLAYLLSPEATLVGQLKPGLFIYSTSFYLAINLIVLFILLPKKILLGNQQLFFNFFFDVAAITLITDASGGITGGLSILLVVCVAASSIMLVNQLATLISAIASLAIITDTALLVNQGHLDFSSFLPSGLLGIVLFITSFFIQNLAKRIRRTQIMADQSAVDLQKMQQLNQLIVQRMRTGILVADHDGQIKMSNAAAIELLGAGEGYIEDSPLSTLPAKLQTQFDQWRKAPQYQTPAFRESESGPELQASFSILTEDTRNDVLIFLEDNRQLAQRAQQMKLASLGRLTASIAHEIRNPLSAINHAAQLLEESEVIDPNDKRMCQIIQKHSDRMNKIVENVLRLSQRHAPNPTRIRLYDWLKQFIAEFESDDYPDADLTLECSSPKHEVTVDISQISQVITNLVLNGLRHSQKQTQKANLTLVFHINNSTRLPVLDIIDDGPGIDDSDIHNIFEPFYTTEAGGTGLGLYISRELCEANQSRLDCVRTESGKSCFRLSFPHPDRRLAPD